MGNNTSNSSRIYAKGRYGVPTVRVLLSNDIIQTQKKKKCGVYPQLNTSATGKPLNSDPGLM